MASRSARRARQPDTVHLHGGSATVPNLVAALSLPPSRAPYLRPLLCLLAHAKSHPHRSMAPMGSRWSRESRLLASVLEVG
ncbi:hypothetical protein QYE76_010698 [Lolium multiflorum]|uniref:Uncharacterized protein n=1 Tax=Lolium multiflorum TaxID=4521 RepID=A0AAD8TVK6_LOLMU|nr:hypothetical protein QYE76_010698 [Lolium multiflorum]